MASAAWGAREPRIVQATFSTSQPLGLVLSPDLVVTGFKRFAPSVPLPAEESGLVHLGDRLISVNGARVAGKRLDEVQRLVSAAQLPKTLTFHSDVPETAGAKAGTGQTGTRQGQIALYVSGVRQNGTLPFTVAAFSGSITCSVPASRVVVAANTFGCGSHDDDPAVADAIVVVQRGKCAFADKAALAQQASARALVVVNADDEVEVMQRAPDDGSGDIAIPAVMITRSTGALLVKRLRAATAVTPATATRPPSKGPPLAQLLLAGMKCAEPRAPRRPPPPASNASHANANASRAAWPSAVIHYSGGRSVEALASSTGCDMTAESVATAYVHAAIGDATACDTSAIPPATDMLIARRGECSAYDKAARAAARGVRTLLLVNDRVEPLFALTPPDGVPPGTPPAICILLLPAGGGGALMGTVASADARGAAENGTKVAIQIAPTIAQAWSDLDALPWAAASNATQLRKMYLRAARQHHPDLPVGSQDRFEALQAAYKSAVAAWERRGGDGTPAAEVDPQPAAAGGL